MIKVYLLIYWQGKVKNEHYFDTKEDMELFIAHRDLKGGDYTKWELID